MAHVREDRILETSTTTGTGTFTVLGPVTGFKRLDDYLEIGDTFDYIIFAVDAVGNPSGEWESGLATYSAVDQFTRTPVRSSNSDAVVNFSAGTKRVALTLTAARMNKVASECIIVACSDETTALTTGAGKITFRMPYAFALAEVRASVNTAPTGAALVVDINESGTTILSTKLSIDASEKTSKTAATPPVISDNALADDAEISIDIDAVGSTIAGAGLKVYLIGERV